VPYSVRVPPLRLLVVSDDAVARAGLRALAEAAGLAVSGDAATEELDPSAEDGADAVLWDVGASGAADGFRAVAARVPVVAVLWTEDQAREALAAGARAVLLRERLDEQLAPAVRAAAAGLVVLDLSLSDTLAAPPRTPPGTEIVEVLTPRESEVLQLLAEGLTNRRIGERLGISEHTVKFHVNAILGKLAAQTRGEAIAQAARLGLLLL
jgi:two-component system nitrate/nitrite response regulator NarL